MQTQFLKIAVAAIVFGTAVALFQGAAHARPSPVGTAFTYQGQLNQGGEPLTDTADLQFSLWDGSDGSAIQVGATQYVLAANVVEGVFSVDVDFGSGLFGADARWLQIAVRYPAGSGAYITLSPRQRVRPAPVASHALGVNGATITNLNASNIATGTISSALLSGAYGNALTLSNASNVFTGSGAGLANLNAGSVATGTLANARTTGNSANVANTLVLRDNSGGFNAGVITANGSGIVGLNASNLSTGTLGSARLSGTYSNALTLNNAGNSFTGNGTGLTNLNASNIDGNLHSTRMPLGGGWTLTSELVTTGPGGANTSHVYNGPTGDWYIRSASSSGKVVINDFVGGNVGIGTSAPAYKLDVAGTFAANTVTIKGGSDLVEGFGSSAGRLDPGTVMVIDPDHAGQLIPSTHAYDSKVAGVVSGANGVNPGLKMGQDGVMDGENLIALTGRVYVKCSTANGEIRPGDRLTTSALAGHAMKATDSEQADGAVIGKAMSSLESGEGLVLVLVNLQ